MHLKRIRVPDFRVLKDIDITFEPDLVPRIFPIGSLNGGGKSTLLQLIFTLLHCCIDRERIPYLQNFLEGFEIESRRDLATIEIVINDINIELNFFCCTDIYVEENSRVLHDIDALSTLDLDNNELGLIICCTGLGQENVTWLICDSVYIQPQDFIAIIRRIQDKIFLTAPITQVFKFLDQTDRALLFKGEKSSNKYYSQLEKAKSELPGFFTYDFLAIELLIKGFLAARDDDFKVAISNGGSYGDSYLQLFKTLERILGDKRVNIEGDFVGVNFTKVDRDGNTIQLYPDDLSHGELKRLSLYMWLKFNKIENSIVLMDEVEIGLHPDWQYKIVNDLQTWAPSNQYILATHSSELCQALTPAHVKEIDPKLLMKK